MNIQNIGVFNPLCNSRLVVMNRETVPSPSGLNYKLCSEPLPSDPCSGPGNCPTCNYPCYNLQTANSTYPGLNGGFVLVGGVFPDGCGPPGYTHGPYNGRHSCFYYASTGTKLVLPGGTTPYNAFWLLTVTVVSYPTIIFQLILDTVDASGSISGSYAWNTTSTSCLGSNSTDMTPSGSRTNNPFIGTVPTARFFQ